MRRLVQDYERGSGRQDIGDSFIMLVEVRLSGDPLGGDPATLYDFVIGLFFMGQPGLLGT
jgi:hypothetical protein